MGGHQSQLIPSSSSSSSLPSGEQVDSSRHNLPHHHHKRAHYRQRPIHQGKVRDDGLKILELKAQTYNGMVRLLKPGYRSIILLTDLETKDKLLTNFRQAIWPYRRNKTLLFGYLCLDKNYLWYKSLLEQVTGIENLNVIKKNCIGTVLSLNGFKKYLRIYHAKHKELQVDKYSQEDDADSIADDDDGGSEELFRNNDNDIENIDIESCAIAPDSSLLLMTGSSSILTGEITTPPPPPLCSSTTAQVDQLLVHLPLWLDRMFDGLTKRYFLEFWPEDMN